MLQVRDLGSSLLQIFFQAHADGFVTMADRDYRTKPKQQATKGLTNGTE